MSSANDRKRLDLEGQRLAKSMSEGRMTFNLGSGHGNVTLSLDRLNAQTVSRIYSTLPEAALYNPKKDVYGNEVMDSEGNIQYDRIIRSLGGRADCEEWFCRRLQRADDGGYAYCYRCQCGEFSSDTECYQTGGRFGNRQEAGRLLMTFIITIYG